MCVCARVDERISGRARSGSWVSSDFSNKSTSNVNATLTENVSRCGLPQENRLSRTENVTGVAPREECWNAKHADYAKHHIYPDDVFFPLAAERSGYIHPTFVSFIDTFLSHCSDSQFKPSVKMDILYAVSHSITYMTASFLKVAAFSLTPSSLKSLFPPPPFIPPLRWAPVTLFHAPRHRTFGTFSHPTGHLRCRASSKAFDVHSPTHRSSHL
jgi:hypothetical protein